MSDATRGRALMMTTTANQSRDEWWSPADLFFLKHALEHGMTHAEVAGFLCREEEEVRNKLGADDGARDRTGTGCGRAVTTATSNARHTATSRRAKQRWRRSLRAGGATNAEAHQEDGTGRQPGTFVYGPLILVPRQEGFFTAPPRRPRSSWRGF